MTLWVFRTIFILASAGTAYSIGLNVGHPYGALILGIGASVGVMVAEWFFSKGSIALISSVVFGALLGLLFATLTVQIIGMTLPRDKMVEFRGEMTAALTVIYCYLGIAFIYQSRDRFNLVVPYIEFRREEKGRQPVVLDTSAIIGGRLPEILGTGAIEGPFIVPQLVLHELHQIADADEKLKRERGRLGLESLHALQNDPNLEIEVRELAPDYTRPVDEQLIRIAKLVNGKLLTDDYNLNRLASLEGIAVINLNQLANALKPVVLPGERLNVKLIKPGEQERQAVGYLQDGTIVIVEDAAGVIGREVQVMVRNTITRDTGRMIFACLADQ
ncbi:MAG: PIN domain-containing protein [Planctomycetes bacterium]|nr:PIN domain-containing protein [Planctomycetota bacterium]